MRNRASRMVTACALALWIAGPFGAQTPALEQAWVRVDRVSSKPRPVAVATERIERNKRNIRVYRAKQLVEMPRFFELVVATPADGEKGLENLVGARVALVRSQKHRDQWEIYAEGAWDVTDLPENVFVVKRVLTFSAQYPIEVQVNGKVHRLKFGQALVVLG